MFDCQCAIPGKILLFKSDITSSQFWHFSGATIDSNFSKYPGSMDGRLVYIQKRLIFFIALQFLFSTKTTFDAHSAYNSFTLNMFCLSQVHIITDLLIHCAEKNLNSTKIELILFGFLFNFIKFCRVCEKINSVIWL